MKKEYWIFLALLVVAAAGAYALGQRSRTSEVIAPPASGTSALSEPPTNAGIISYADAPAHIGEYATVEGAVVTVYTSKSGTTFFDYCAEYDSCPFSAVIFSSDAAKFGTLARYQGKTLRVTGALSSYQGRAEIVIKDPSQIAD